jgi:4-amino-4-deoxy-L-arabinose transferase-like glycosyltransferase
MAPTHAMLVSAGVVMMWGLWAVLFNTAQFGDNVEQFNWAQSLELGYRKHPPLPSWALATVIRLFGPSIYWAYALATLCLLGTLALTWLIGRELLGARVAAAAIVLWGLNLSFSQRAQLYNHNTVLVLFIAATVWCAMRAARARSPTRWWIATGLGAAAAMLSKYQAIVPLAALLVALARTGGLNRPAQLRGLALAVSLLLLLCAPHALWVRRHDFSTVRYASDAVVPADLLHRLGFVVAFAANQLRLAFPALLTIALCWAWARSAPAAPAPKAADEGAPAAQARVWFGALVGAPLIVLVVMALAGGVSLRNHWGVQALQFFPLWLAACWERRAAIDLRRLVRAALIVQGLSLSIYALDHGDPNGVLSRRRIDTMYPAQRLARAAVAHWADSTSCPLRYVAGSVFDAGLVALYTGGRLEVFDTASATPWVRLDDLQQRGVLYVLDEGEALPEGVTHVVPFDLVAGPHPGRAAKTIRLGVLMPLRACP